MTSSNWKSQYVGLSKAEQKSRMGRLIKALEANTPIMNLNARGFTNSEIKAARAKMKKGGSGRGAQLGMKLARSSNRMERG